MQIKLYRSIDIYYLKLLQHLVGAAVGPFLENILPWPGVPLLLLGGNFRQSLVQSLSRASCRALGVLRAALRAELRAELRTEPRAAGPLGARSSTHP